MAWQGNDIWLTEENILVLTGSTPTVAGPFSVAGPTVQNSLPNLSGTRPSVQTVSGLCLRRICLLNTSALSALEVL